MAEIDVVINDKYIPYLNRDERYQIFYGGSGSGKSHFIATNLVLELFNETKTLMVVRNTFTSIRDSVYSEIVQALQRMDLYHLVKVYKSTFDIEFPNGSKIIFKGADDENKLLSIVGVDIVWIEEAYEITKEIFNQLELRLRGGSHKKKFFLSFNPINSQSWLKEEFFDNPKDDSFICHSTYLDNKFLDEAYIATMLDMKERNPEKYKVFALGEWGNTGKAVFTNWKEEEFDPYKIIRENPQIKLALGLDFGFVDPSVLAVALVNLEDKTLYIIDEIYQSGLTNDKLAELIIEKGYSKHHITADSAEAKSIEEMKRNGIRKIQGAKKGAGSIRNGVQFISQFDVRILPTCTNALREFENYSYLKDKKTGQYTDKMEDANNHFIDALRYAMEQFSRPFNKIKFLPKSMLGL